MLVRVENPLRDLTREQKITIAVAGGAVVAIATLATVAWASKSDGPAPRRSIVVGDGCSSFVVESETQLQDDLRGMVRKSIRAGSVDPFSVAAQYVKQIAPSCPTYPGNVQSPVQVKLFAAVFMTLLEVMQQEQLLASQDYITWSNMMSTWAAGQGVSPSEL